jgi:hypothetical protein
MDPISRYSRKWITLPDGREVAGRSPGRSGVSCFEHLLRDQLARQIGGVTEVCLPYGSADVMTTRLVFEVESLAKWRHGVRQVLGYAAQTGLPPALALYGDALRDDVLKMYIKLRDGSPRIHLWWHTGQTWREIHNRTLAGKNMVTPAEAYVRRLDDLARGFQGPRLVRPFFTE